MLGSRSDLVPPYQGPGTVRTAFDLCMGQVLLLSDIKYTIAVPYFSEYVQPE